MTRTTRRRLMDRKIVELLMQGASVSAIVRSLKAGKKRIKRLREKAKSCGYLPPEGRGAGPTPLPAYPEAVFPDAADKRAWRQSSEHRKLEGIRAWIEGRIEAGWDPITVYEELPAEIAGEVSRSSFYRYLARSGLVGAGKADRVIPEIAHDAGEALILDWGKLRRVPDPVSGRDRIVWAFIGVMGYSRRRLVRLVWRMDAETTLRAVESMFRELGGVPKKITIDNPKCIALSASRYEALLNPVAERFAGHYGFFWECLPPYEPQQKGHVETQVPYMRRLLQARDGVWEGLEAEEAYLRGKVEVSNGKPHGTTRRRPLEVWEAEEKTTMKALPALDYAMEQYSEGLVRRDGYVRFDSRYYAVGAGLTGKLVTIIADARQVTIYRESQLVEVYERSRDPRQMKVAKRHHLKPWEQSLGDSGFYAERAGKLGPNVGRWVEEVLRQGQGFVDTRKVWGVLSLDKRYLAAEIDQACARSLEIKSLSYRVVERFIENARIAAGRGGPLPAIVPPGGGHKYARSLAEYEDLLPGIGRHKEEGHA
ncbi:MAG: IS21 family transposase [Elusimicrobiales bacterium]